jgi:hypothetical protein
MADTGTGIQELMAAETRASQIVAEARIGTFAKKIAFPASSFSSRLFLVVQHPPSLGRKQVRFLLPFPWCIRRESSATSK